MSEALKQNEQAKMVELQATKAPATDVAVREHGRLPGVDMSDVSAPLLVCSIEGCNGRPHARGWCEKHYSRWKRKGHVEPRPSLAGLVCVIKDCSEPQYARGWCPLHYKRWLANGDPLVLQRIAPPEVRFWRYVVQRGPDECWIWTGTTNNNGYGYLGVGSDRHVYAHRLSWQYHNQAEIPPAMHVMHSCDNPPCVNPVHLSLGTHADNMADMRRKGRQRKSSAT